MTKKHIVSEEPLTEADVDPTVDSPEVAHDSYTPPDYPNSAADPDEPYEPTRPETREERRQRRIEEAQVADAAANTQTEPNP